MERQKRPISVNAEELTIDSLLAVRAVMVTDQTVAVEIWTNYDWTGASDSPALLIRVPKLLAELVVPVRRRILQLGLGEGLLKRGALRV